MARFLSPDWFAEIAQHPAPDGDADLVVDQIVRDTPDGEVRYRVEVTGAGARITTSADTDAPPDLTISTDWITAIAVATGELATTGALMTGRLRVKGNLARLSGRAADLLGVDPVPAEVRRHTTY